jgi:hypothetical protein
MVLVKRFDSCRDDCLGGGYYWCTYIYDNDVCCLVYCILVIPQER